MHPLRCILLSTIPTILFAVACGSAAEDRLPPKLAFTRAAKELRFDTGVLRGALGEDGKSLGLRPLTTWPPARRLPAPLASFRPIAC